MQITEWSAFTDIESKSECDLKRSGSFKYALHPSTEVILFQVARGWGEVEIYSIIEGETLPDELLDYLNDDRTQIIGINFQHFDRQVLKHAMGMHIPIRKVIDIRFLAYRLSLPGNLNDLCYALGVPQEKSKLSSDYMFSIPIAASKKKDREEYGDFYLPEHKPTEWAYFKNEYSKMDIVAMRECFRRMPDFANSAIEDEVLYYDLEMAERGVTVDQELALQGAALVKKVVSAIKDAAIARYGVNPAGNKWLALIQDAAPAYDIKDTKKTTVGPLLDDDDFPDEAKELIQIRQVCMQKASSKYQAFIDGVCPDGRIRGMIIYGGASRTLRWSATLAQLQNMSRGSIHGIDLELAIAMLRRGRVMKGQDAQQVAESCVRPCLLPATGKRMVVSDFSQIEARVLPWLCGYQQKLNTFIEVDEAKKRGEKVADVYQRAAGQIFMIDPVDVSKDLRQAGKICELALGFQGSVGALNAMCKVYRFDLHKEYSNLWPKFPQWAKSEAMSGWGWLKKHNNLPTNMTKRAWLVAKTLVIMWRAANEPIVQAWADMDAAVRKALKTPGREYTVGLLKVRQRLTSSGKPSRWFTVQLPSGRYMVYQDMRVRIGSDRREVLEHKGSAGAKELLKAKAAGKSLSKQEKAWTYIETYGGKLMQGATQATARDRMAHAMPRIARRGFDLLFPVHDELVTEVPAEDWTLNAEELDRLMIESVGWDVGLPVAAAGEEFEYYQKGD